MSSRNRNSGLTGLRKRLSGRVNNGKGEGRRGEREEGADSEELEYNILIAPAATKSSSLADSLSSPPSSSDHKVRSSSISPPSSPRSRSLSQASGSRGNRVTHSMSEISDDDEEELGRNMGVRAAVVGKAPSDVRTASRGRERPPAGNMFQRLRERSRSRSRSKSRSRRGSADEDRKEVLVAVTSCRSDGYYNQKAPGSTSKLPRKAPTNLKLFHELAVGVKDAYAAVGAIPRKPTDEENKELSGDEHNGKMVLWDFVGNLDFLLALVDEVSVDTVTRGALKDDQAFRGLRDVIKKCNRVLEEMLVRRERKYTLLFRLVQPLDLEQIDRMKTWNMKVDKAVGAVTGPTRDNVGTDSEGLSSDTDTTSSTTMSGGGNRTGVFSRGRQLLPTAGRVRSRRATPTPRLRQHRSKGDATESESDGGSAAEDGFSVHTDPGLTLQSSYHDEEILPVARTYQDQNKVRIAPLQQVQPKDELVDVIRGLRIEKIRNKENAVDNDLAALKPNWLPKADIPSSVPKLPFEYVHRHRLMKQVVSYLLDEIEPQVSAEGATQNTAITCVTSRHGDKAGNGKSILAVAVIQTVEVRERFPDGIAWLKIGRGPLTERDIRRLYEDLYRQLVVKEADMDASVTEDGNQSFNGLRSDQPETRIQRVVDRADSVRRFLGGDLEGIKEDLGRMLIKQKVLICLDDVWRVEDAKWFIFETPSYKVPPRDSPFKVLITTRTPALLGNGLVPEVFVRILSEHEAVKLLLSTAGRKPYGGRNSEVFNQSRLIVKGCGNSPLGILLVGAMLRHNNRNWNLKSPVWTGVFNQCSLNLEEAAQLRSFRNAFIRIVDMSFFTIPETDIRIALRRCFVYFAMAFRANDWMLSGRGIPQSILLKFFDTIILAGPTGVDPVTSTEIISMLEQLKLIQRAGHSIAPPSAKSSQDSPSSNENDKGNCNEKSDSEWDEFDEQPKRPVQQFYTMHDSLKAVAELMADRSLPAFFPKSDNFTFFTDLIADEKSFMRECEPAMSAPPRFLFTKLAESNSSKLGYSKGVLSEEKVHELVAISIVGGGDDKALSKSSISDAMKANQLSIQTIEGGDKFEEYSMSFLPDHLRCAKAYSCAADLLTNGDFVRRRVLALGIMEATGRQVADILNLRSFAAKGKELGSKTPFNESPPKSPAMGDDSHVDIKFLIDVDVTVCEAARNIIDEVYKVTNSMGSSDSLGMATCLATVGEALLKSRQPRDAMVRLEEAVSLYRGLLGQHHVFTAHALQSVAKALMKLGEARVALLKFAEAARIYEECNATLHYDSIANAQSLASLLVDIGDIRKAEAMFEEVISMKQTVYGKNSVPVAKTINSYAILLAKHGRMNDALRNYDIAKATYLQVPPPIFSDPEFEIKCNYDVTLITLNIASIYSKRQEPDKALACYEEGVRGLNAYEAAIEEIKERHGSSSSSASSHKHMVAALGRIGSLKMKLGNNQGALVAYLALIKEVDDDSPLTSHVEEAKAHIKCATIFRQRENPKDHGAAITHLREALRMYKALYGPDHKDTTAIAASLKQWLAEEKNK